MATIYNGDYDNFVKFQLAIDGAAYDTTNITQIDAVISGMLISSTNQADEPIRWNQVGFSIGEIRGVFGGLNVKPGTHKCYFTIYDSVYTNGLVFDPIEVTFRDLPINVEV